MVTIECRYHPDRRRAQVLAYVSPSPVVELNRAVAVGNAHGAARGLEIVDGLVLPNYPLLPALRAGTCSPGSAATPIRLWSDLPHALSQRSITRCLDAEPWKRRRHHD
jgi:hypothetical protein